MASLNSSGQDLGTLETPDYHRDVSTELFRLIYRPLVIAGIICIGGFFSLYGMVTNAINMAVFRRQGILSDSCTVSLTALALSDFILCFFHSIWVAGEILRLFFLSTINPKFAAYAYALYVGRAPAHSFVQLSCLVTVYIALERCYSVVRPFKVKQVFNVKHTLVAMCCLYLGNFAFELPTLLAYIPYLEDKDDNILKTMPFLNLTAVSLVLKLDDFFPRVSYKRNTALPATILNPLLHFSKFGIRPFCLIAVFIFNLTIYFKVKQSKKFKESVAPATRNYQKKNRGNGGRHESSATNQTSVGGGALSRGSGGCDQKTRTLLRMITVLCTVFMVSSTVTCVMHVINMTQPMRSTQHNAFTQSFNVLIEASDTINGAINFNIYCSMSSRFKTELKTLCSCRKPSRGRQPR